MADILPPPASSNREESPDISPPSPALPPGINEPKPQDPIVPDSSCPHLLTLWDDEDLKELFLKKYKSIVIWGGSRSWRSSHVAKKRHPDIIRCGHCRLLLIRPAICMHCSFAGCRKAGHITEHLRSTEHNFFIDVKSGSLFCMSCDDFVYSQSLEQVYSSIMLSLSNKLLRFRDAKRPREPYAQWLPSPKERDSLLSDTSIVSCQGRRGILNLGQTCAMNTVLQSFIHNPLLRNYFLSDKHPAKLCKNKDCMCCEMDRLFSEVFSGDQSPYGPLNFLPILWRSSSSSLSEGYAQQDAHEVFITCLSQVHANSKGSTNVSCNCIIHSTFAGVLSSEVKCGKISCKHISMKLDPMLDVSLELKAKMENAEGSENTLAACLRRFTQPEKLPAREYTCSQCGSNSGATKGLTFRKLPPVLAFQLKRFGHKSADKSTAQKITTPISFPATLDMSPFTTSGFSQNVGPDTLYMYDLYCVINHEGAMDTGHYTNFARFADEWYRFDDDKVTHATMTQVLSSTAYLLFYVKRSLDYKPDSRPSYVITREAEALKERQREREKELKLSQEIDDELMSIL